MGTRLYRIIVECSPDLGETRAEVEYKGGIEYKQKQQDGRGGSSVDRLHIAIGEQPAQQEFTQCKQEARKHGARQYGSPPGFRIRQKFEQHEKPGAHQEQGYQLPDECFSKIPCPRARSSGVW